LSEPGFHPNTASGALDSSLPNREPDAGTGIFCGAMEALEDTKNLLLVSGIDPILLSCIEKIHSFPWRSRFVAAIEVFSRDRLRSRRAGLVTPRLFGRSEIDWKWTLLERFLALIVLSSVSNSRTGR
jgi:hypothetical protein